MGGLFYIPQDRLAAELNVIGITTIKAAHVFFEAKFH